MIFVYEWGLDNVLKSGFLLYPDIFEVKLVRKRLVARGWIGTQTFGTVRGVGFSSAQAKPHEEVLAQIFF